MTRSLPPLNALRAFEAAARHLNMSRAAEELFVTPAAVSHQVIALEAHLGRKLFTRLQHGLALTADGSAYLPPVARAFDSLRQAASVFDSSGGPLTIAAPPAFSSKWLTPRLAGLRTVLPTIAIVNEDAGAPHERPPARADVAIRYGPGAFGGLVAHRLLAETAIPVCHPDLLRSGPALTEPADMLRHTLLHGRESLPGEGFPDWRQWFAWAGAPQDTIQPGLTFDHHLTTVQAALEAQGIALVKRSIVMTDLIRGNLVQLVQPEYPLAFAHFLVHGADTARGAEIETLKRWLDQSLSQTVRDLPAAILPTAPDP